MRSWRARGAARRPAGDALYAPMGETDTAVLDTLSRELFHPTVVDVVEEVMASLAPTDGGKAERLRIELALGQVERELRHYVETIATVGPIDEVIAALKAREARRASLQQDLAGLDAATRIRSVDRRRLERVLRETLTNGRAVLARPDVPERRQMLRRVLRGRLAFTPHPDRPERRYTFTGQATLGPIIGSVASGEGITSPWGFEPVFRMCPDGRACG